MDLARYFNRIGIEPPFRLLTRALVRRFCRNVETRARWSVDPYPHYQFAIAEGARLAEREGLDGITVVEFGIGTGRGLVAMERHAQAVERLRGIKVSVIGFDSGAGLPSFIGDYRDHPDWWKPGDYRIDLAALERQVDPERTRIIIGDVRDTVPRLLAQADFLPIGFISFDLDLYSSTRAALEIIADDRRKMLRQTPLYFDDIEFVINHRWAGELLAIDEFNKQHRDVKIDQWYNIRHDKPFPEQYMWSKLMIAHDLRAISSYQS